MNHKLHILIVDEVHEELMICLKELGIDYTYSPEIAVDAIPGELLSYNGIIVRSKLHLTSEFLQMQPQLKFIARAGSGMDNIDLDEAERRNIMCVNAGEANADAVAEHALGLLLSLQHKIVKSNRELVQNKWDREGNRGQEIGTKTIGIIGFGNTGSALARKLQGFGCRVIAYDKYKKGFASHYVEEVSLEYLESKSDIISFHIPLTSETTDWIRSEWLFSLKNNVTLMNLSRGGIMKIQDVIEEIKSGKITRFATDVLENERLKSFNDQERQDFEWLNDQENVILTPHVAGWSQESYVKISKVLGDKIASYVRGGIIMTETSEKNRQIVG
ncbi:MAG: phosphoglycerate dehydrogenase [Bacteroidetes bacterium]|nr:phosphoglycerate dehydrogenase [Bacteroidota bacterium]